MDLNDSELKAALLNKLARRRCWHNKHTSFENTIKKGFKPKYHNKLKKITRELIKENILLNWHTAYGERISLNHKRSQEIKRIIEVN